MEELTLLAAAPISCKKQHQVKEGFLFSCLTGLRISDVLKIRYSDIKEGVLQYRQQKSKVQFHYLPLSGQAQELISSLQADPRGEFLFWDLNRKITHSQRLHILDEWVKSAGIKRRITFHVGRHTYATLLLTFGQDIYTVSKLLGHSSVSMTERYGKIINTKKTEAVNKIPRILHKGETRKEGNINGTADMWDRLGMEEFDAMLREVFCEKIPELA
jgi:integrase